MRRQFSNFSGLRTTLFPWEPGRFCGLLPSFQRRSANIATAKVWFGVTQVHCWLHFPTLRRLWASIAVRSELQETRGSLPFSRRSCLVASEGLSWAGVESRAGTSWCAYPPDTRIPISPRCVSSSTPMLPDCWCSSIPENIDPNTKFSCTFFSSHAGNPGASEQNVESLSSTNREGLLAHSRVIREINSAFGCVFADRISHKSHTKNAIARKPA